MKGDVGKEEKTNETNYKFYTLPENLYIRRSPHPSTPLTPSPLEKAGSTNLDVRSET